MKKIFYIFAAATMLLASCSSDDNTSIETPNVPVQTLSKKNLKLNINIANPEDNDLTRAFVKNGWVNGDILKIWFDGSTGNATSNPDLVIKYDGSKWNVDKDALVSKNMPSETGSGTMKVVYDGDVKFSTKKAYTYNKTDQSLTATLNDWQYMTEIQVVVTGISDAASNYTLSCDHLTAFNSYNVTAEGVTASVKAVDSPVDGISNADGIAFVFAASNKYGEPANYRFTLIKKDENGNIASEKYFIGTNKNIARSTSKLIGLKLNIATFHDLADMENADDYVTIGRLQWAKMNLGATTEAGDYSTCMGDYYAWGEIAPRYSTISRPSSNTVEFLSWKETYKDSKYGSSTKLTRYSGTNLDNLHDAAAVALGNGWRTPSTADFVALINECQNTTYSAGNQLNGITVATEKTDLTVQGIYYVTNYNKVAGLLFVDKSGNKLFFPIAYWINSGALQNATNETKTIYFWTNESSSTTQAKYFNYTYDVTGANNNVTSRITVGNAGMWYYGYTIRPVRTIPTSGN